MIRVRPAQREDCSGILEIYNDAVLTTTATYDYEPRTLAHRQAWFDDHRTIGFPIFVALDQTGRIVGWSALNRYHDRMGYRFTTENSIYIAADHRGQGIGKMLLSALIESAKRISVHAIIAAIDAANEPSIRLHRGFGFEQVGHFRRVGYKFDRWLDVVYLELLLPEPQTEAR
jgi:L-amino acid N-acyltransferase